MASIEGFNVADIEWRPVPALYRARQLSGRFWASIAEKCIATGHAAVFRPDKLPLKDAQGVVRAVSAFNVRNPALLKERGLRLTTHVADDGAVHVFVVKVA